MPDKEIKDEKVDISAANGKTGGVSESEAKVGEEKGKSIWTPAGIATLLGAIATIITAVGAIIVPIYLESQKTPSTPLSVSTSTNEVKNPSTTLETPDNKETPTQLVFLQSFQDTYRKLADDGHFIRKVAFTAESGWVILYDTSGVSSFGIPEEASYTLDQLGEEGKDIKSITFTSDSGWVILYDKNDAVWRDIPNDAAMKLLELGNADEEVKHIAFTKDSGWVILFNRNKAVWRGIPEDAATKLHELDSEMQEDEIKTIAFTNNSGWIILLGWADAWASPTPQVPQDAWARIGEIANAGEDEIKDIAFTSDSGWIILLGRSDAWWANVPP